MATYYLIRHGEADYSEMHDKVIFVGHGMAFRTLMYIEQMKPAEIVECTYEPGKEDCVYSFY
jgi:broad specificity phosphatase PhoE